MEKISICLSDIPENARKKSDKNQKIYCEIIVDKRKESDQFGNDLTVYINQSKEAREAKSPKVYIGNGKTYNFEKKVENTAPKEEIQEQQNDLPF